MESTDEYSTENDGYSTFTVSEFTTSSSVTESVVTIWPPPLAGSIVLTCVWAVGMVGNAVIIFTFLKSQQLRIPASIFYVNLAIADLIFNTFYAFISISMLVHDGVQYYGDTACFVQATLLMATVPAGFDCIGSIVISRYIIIVHPSKKKYMTWRVCIGVCLLCWIPPCLLVIPNFTGWGRVAWLPRQYHCSYDWGYNRAHDVLFLIFNFGAVSVVMVFCYVRIYVVYRRSKKRVAANEGCKRQKGIKKVEFRLALQLFVLFALYNLFWTPAIAFILFIDPHGKGPTWAYMTVTILCCFNSAVNIFVYLYYNTKFRLECMKVCGIESIVVAIRTSSNTKQTNVSSNSAPINIIS